MSGAVIRHTAYFRRGGATFMLIVHHWVPFGRAKRRCGAIAAHGDTKVTCEAPFGHDGSHVGTLPGVDFLTWRSGWLS